MRNLYLRFCAIGHHVIEGESTKEHKTDCIESCWQIKNQNTGTAMLNVKLINARDKLLKKKEKKFLFCPI